MLIWCLRFCKMSFTNISIWKQIGSYSHYTPRNINIRYQSSKSSTNHIVVICSDELTKDMLNMQIISYVTCYKTIVNARLAVTKIINFSFIENKNHKISMPDKSTFIYIKWNVFSIMKYDTTIFQQNIQWHIFEHLVFKIMAIQFG